MGTQSWLWADGQWERCDGIPLSDRGFRHGMSIFETLRICRGKLVALDEHLEKLRSACAEFGFRPPPDELATFAPGIEHGMARIYVTAGDGNFRDPLNLGRILLLVEETTAEGSKSPSSLTISKTPHTVVWPGFKTGNYWPQIAASRHAAERGSDEMVLINSNQHVISASLANLFAVIDGLLLTPRVSSGARAGVTRDWVIAQSDVIISDFHPEQLRTASEVFLTNSAYGIAPIQILEGRPLNSTSLGHDLLADYQQWLKR